MPLGAAVAAEVAEHWWSGPQWSPQLTQTHQSTAGKSKTRKTVIVTDDLSGEDTPPLEVISDDATSPLLQEAEHTVFDANAKRLRTDSTSKVNHEAGQDMIHESHTTTCTRGLIWCRVCGNYMPTRMRTDRCLLPKLQGPCALHASGMGSVYRSRLSDGLLPKSNMARWPDGTPAAQKRLPNDLL